MGDTTSSSYGSFVELSRWANPEALKEFGGGEPWVVALVCTTAAALFIVPMIYFFVGELFTDAVYEERVGGANRLPKEVRDKRAREAAKAAKQA
ncbi:unnamed protein product [Pedinophyceae sp. YPF-701]|nr:unnamed protein product [Pedinophyceae sp. YPF-701]